MRYLSKTNLQVGDFEVEFTVLRRTNSEEYDNEDKKHELDVPALKMRLSPLPFLETSTADQNIEIVHDPHYYLDMIELRAENIIFKVPAIHLKGATIPEYWGVGEPMPLCVKTARAADLSILFELMDQGLSPSSSHSVIDMSIEDWLAVLQISRAWSFQTFQQMAEAKLREFKLTTPEMIRYGRQFQLQDSLLAAYQDIIIRTETVRLEEAIELGMGSLVKLTTFREELREKYLPRLVEDSRALQEKSKAALAKVLEVQVEVVSQGDAGDAVGRALLAEEEGVLEWLVDAYSELIRRGESLTHAEARQLGLDTAVTIYRCREAYKAAYRAGDDDGFLEDVIKSNIDEHLRSKASNLGVVGRISVATRYGVVRWLHNAYLELIERGHPINIFEAGMIGMDRFAILCRARDRYLKSLRRNGPQFTSEKRKELIHKVVSLTLESC